MNRNIEKEAEKLPAEVRSGASNEPETAELCAQIAGTRADMSGTLDAIQERLSPSYLKEQVKEQVKDSFEDFKQAVRDATVGKVEHMVERASDVASQTGRTTIETIKSNPIPFALIGIGACWLLWNQRSVSGKYGPYEGRYGTPGEYDWGRSSWGGRFPDRESSSLGSQRGVTDRIQESLGDTVDQARNAAADFAAKTRETFNSAMDRTQETAAYVAETAKDRARQAQNEFNNVLHEKPLALAMAAVAAGIGVGLALPQTQKENELMGDARDRVVDKAQQVTSDAMDKAREVADRVSDEVARDNR